MCSSRATRSSKQCEKWWDEVLEKGGGVQLHSQEKKDSREELPTASNINSQISAPGGLRQPTFER